MVGGGKLDFAIGSFGRLTISVIEWESVIYSVLGRSFRSFAPERVYVCVRVCVNAIEEREACHVMVSGGKLDFAIGSFGRLKFVA